MFRHTHTHTHTHFNRDDPNTVTQAYTNQLSSFFQLDSLALVLSILFLLPVWACIGQLHSSGFFIFYVKLTRTVHSSGLPELAFRLEWLCVSKVSIELILKAVCVSFKRWISISAGVEMQKGEKQVFSIACVPCLRRRHLQYLYWGILNLMAFI